jgi:hypothetical protein
MQVDGCVDFGQEEDVNVPGVNGFDLHNPRIFVRMVLRISNGFQSSVRNIPRFNKQSTNEVCYVQAFRCGGLWLLYLVDPVSRSGVLSYGSFLNAFRRSFSFGGSADLRRGCSYCS